MKHWWDYLEGKLKYKNAYNAFIRYSISTKTPIKVFKFSIEEYNKYLYISEVQKYGLIQAPSIKIYENIDKSLHFNEESYNIFYNTHTYLELTRDVYKYMLYPSCTDYTKIIKIASDNQSAFGSKVSGSVVTLNSDMETKLIFNFKNIIDMDEALE